jgi:hypothetical protein
MRRVDKVAQMEKTRNAHKFLVENLKETGQLKV